MGWQVPPEHHDWWLTKINIKLFDLWPDELVQQYPGINAGTPGFSVEEHGVRSVYFLASWFNPGTIAHEQAHHAWVELTAEQRTAFEQEYHPIIKTNPLIKLLYSQNTYGLTSIAEGHAEVYRYLGQSMPDVLKKFYPKLF